MFLCSDNREGNGKNQGGFQGIMPVFCEETHLTIEKLNAITILQQGKNTDIANGGRHRLYAELAWKEFNRLTGWKE